MAHYRLPEWPVFNRSRLAGFQRSLTFEVRLERLHPRPVVPFRDLDRSVTQGNRNSFNIDAALQQGNRERIPEAVRPGSLDPALLEQPGEALPPVPDDRQRCQGIRAGHALLGVAAVPNGQNLTPRRVRNAAALLEGGTTSQEPQSLLTGSCPSFQEIQGGAAPPAGPSASCRGTLISPRNRGRSPGICCSTPGACLRSIQ